MIGIGLKTELWNKYKALITKDNQGYSSALDNVKGGTRVRKGNVSDKPVVNLDTVIADVYYMAYSAVGGKKDKLNGKLFNLDGVSQIMWCYFMCVRATALGFHVHKKDRITPPYLLADLQRICASKGLRCNIQDRGNGSAGIEIGLNGSGISSSLQYSSLKGVLNYLNNVFTSIMEMQLSQVLGYNEIDYVKQTMLRLGHVVVKDLY